MIGLLGLLLPSLSRLKNTRLLVRVGLDYDVWLNRLIKQSGRTDLTRGGEAVVDASRNVLLLEVKQGGFQSDGHAHGAGNPHYWLDPDNAAVITGNIAEALARLDPTHARQYVQQRNAFLALLKEKTLAWQDQLKPWAGVPLLVYHNNWPYLARRFKLNMAATVETRPGVAPSPKALATLVQTVQTRNIRWLIRQPSEPTRDLEFIARKTGAHIVSLAASVGDAPGINNYVDLFEYNVQVLQKALSATPGSQP
ncbi:metal ABC transporter substrate-binding protein [Limnobacter humi]|uniref:Metal ABC transporter substrate-binding protein n=1 Tax=Limnobacter humi TaxID=1778671 RepID=A0ABT1WCQ2_9BURK|nr:metal ABC transporter substrate-binding protein [Limnobacter humi]MCQ8895280.1 metal ABC transporter substrate-binding protein [Limnobacter humi]